MERGISSIVNPVQNGVDIWRPGWNTPTQNLPEYPPLALEQVLVFGKRQREERIGKEKGKEPLQLSPIQPPILPVYAWLPGL